MRATTAERIWCWGNVRDVRAYSVAERSFRTVLLLTVVAVFSFFDLAFTHSQLSRGNFAEANALAAAVVPGAAGMIAYKTVLFGVGASLLYRLRRRWESEAGLWLLATFYAGLMVWWLAYLAAAEVCIGDPAVFAPLTTY
jgi:uncharacterized membrane protein